MAKYFFFSLFFILLGSFFIWPSFCVQAFGVSPATFDLQVYRGDKSAFFQSDLLFKDHGF
jgi:hypothetical protein